MAETIKSIKSSGGDYTILAAWEAAISANPIDDQTANIDEAFNAGAVTINVANGNNKTIKVTAAAAYRHYAQGVTIALAATAARIVTTSEAAVNVATSDVILEWLYIDSTFAVSGPTLYPTSAFTLRYCIIDAHGTDVNNWPQNLYINVAAGTSTVHNCFFISRATYWNSVVMHVAEGTTNFYNCMVYSISSGTHSIGFYRAVGTMNCYNCISSATSEAFSGTIGGNYNMSSDATAPGATNWRSITMSNVLVNLTSGSEDLHMKSDVFGDYVGGDYSGTIGSIDIDGITRPVWDIGADGSGTSATITSLDDASLLVFKRRGSGVYVCSSVTLTQADADALYIAYLANTAHAKLDAGLNWSSTGFSSPCSNIYRMGTFTP